MATFTIVVAIVGAFLAWLINRSFFNPITLVLVLFAGVTFLPTLHLYGLYDFPNLAFEITLWGVSLIFVGAMAAVLLDSAATASRKNGRGMRRTQSKLDIGVSYKLANVVAIIAITVLIATRLAILTILISGGDFAAVRSYFLGYGGTVGFAGTLDELAGRLIVSPIMFALTPVFVYGVVVGPTNKVFNYLFLIATTLNLLTTGGRIIFVYAMVQFVVLYALHHRARVRLKRGHVTWAVLALAAVVVGVTASRGNAILYEAYTYFAIPLPLLGHWSEWADSQGVFTNGLAFLYGIVTLVVNLIGAFGYEIAGPVIDAVSAPQDRWVELLPGRPFNAFVTAFYYFYLDFRLPGVALFSFISGFIVQRIYGKAKSEGGAWPTLLLLLVIQGVVVAFVRWQPTDGAYVLSFVLLWVLARPRPVTWRVQALAKRGQRRSLRDPSP